MPAGRGAKPSIVSARSAPSCAPAIFRRPQPATCGAGATATNSYRWPAELPRLAPLFALPLRRALVEERLHAFAKIATHVAHQDQVLAFLAGEPPLQARQRLLGGVERERRMPGDLDGKLVNATLQRRQIFDDFGEQSGTGGFLGADQPRGEDDVLDARRPNQSGQPADIGHRQAIAQRTGDRKAYSRRLGADAQIATRRDAGAASGAGARDRGNGGHAALLELGENAVDA